MSPLIVTGAVLVWLACGWLAAKVAIREMARQFPTVDKDGGDVAIAVTFTLLGLVALGVSLIVCWPTWRQWAPFKWLPAADLTSLLRLWGER